MVGIMLNRLGRFIDTMRKQLDPEVKVHKQNCRTNISRYKIRVPVTIGLGIYATAFPASIPASYLLSGIPQLPGILLPLI